MNRKQEQNSTVTHDDGRIDRIARNVQTSLIPLRPPLVDGLAMASLFRPGTGPGKDYFEILHLSDEKLALFLFTLRGDPLDAALVGPFARMKFIEHLARWRPPSSVIERVYSEITREITREFSLTAFVGNLDLVESTLSWCNAGLPAAGVFQEQTGSMVSLPPQNPVDPAGSPGALAEKSTRLRPGDWLFLFSAGLKPLYREKNDDAGAFLCSVKADSGNTPDRFTEIIRNLHGESERSGQDDLSLVALEMLTRSRRSQINESLGFYGDAPVRHRSLHSFEEMDGAVRAVLKSLDGFGYPDEVIRKMKVSIIELVANAITHGNGKDPGKQVVIGYLVDARKAVVSIVDEGPGFDPGSIPDPTLPENICKDCGRGLFLVRHLVDRLEFNEAGNRVTITKFHSVE